uniref:Link domain-containing protein n=1 Tax=viral metagenome TaxID=1070528 RepID=A0A6C0B2Y0_9ZZZZ
MGSSDDDNNLTSDLTKLYNMVFNKSTLLLIMWFLALHFVCYRLLKVFYSENLDTLDYQTKLSRMLDIAVFSFLLLFLTASYYSVPDTDKEIMLENLADSFKTYANDNDSIYKTVVFLLFFYCAIYLFRIPMNSETKPAFVAWTEFGAWTLFLIIVFVKFFNDVFGFSMIDIIYSYFDWSSLPETTDVNNSIKVTTANVEEDEEDCEDEEEPPSYLSKVLSYVTPAPKNKPPSITKKPSSKPTTFSSVLTKFVTTLASGSSVTSNTTPVKVPTTTLSSNISKNTSTTNSLRDPVITTTLSSNISTNTSTTNGLRDPAITTTLSSNISTNTSTTNGLRDPATTTTKSSGVTMDSSTTTTNQSGFRNIKESFNTMAPSSNNTNTQKQEVFNVSGNFTYDDAQVVCAAYGASLADYDQIEETYNNGGEWCNYGWSAGQYAYFPTQKTTWDKLKQSSDPKIQQSCGRQGINGGYVSDKTKQLGINCYGHKPAPLDKDYELRQQQQSIINAKTKEDIELESKIQYWKQQIDGGTISVNHYNQTVWSNFDTSPPPGQTTLPNQDTTLPNQDATFGSEQNDYEQNDYEQNNYEQNNYEQNNYEQNNYEQSDNVDIGTVQYNNIPTTLRSIVNQLTTLPALINSDQTTKGTVQTTKGPEQTTKGPVQTTKGPVQTTKGPVQTTIGPPKMNNPNFNPNKK